MRGLTRILGVLALAALLGLGGCAETGFLAQLGKLLGGTDRATEGAELVIGAPYQIDGVTYRPEESYSLDQTGIAAWYGEERRGQRTANGETFDPDRLTAAHQTLQLPAIVRVTNLENGRSIVVRVNDRGPWRNDRVIDLSRRAAELLGFREQGAARVRVQVLGDESRGLSRALRSSREGPVVPLAVATAPRASVASESLAPPPGARSAAGRSAFAPGTSGAEQAARATELAMAAPAPVRTVPSRLPERVEQGHAQPSALFIQAGAFAAPANAARMSARLRRFGDARVEPVASETGRTLWRVRIGPYAGNAEAEAMLRRVHAGRIGEARIVVDTFAR